MKAARHLFLMSPPPVIARRQEHLLAPAVCRTPFKNSPAEGGRIPPEKGGGGEQRRKREAKRTSRNGRDGRGWGQ